MDRQVSTRRASEEVQLKEQVDEYEVRIAALERKVGQLTMELDVAKKTASQLRSLSDEQPSIISGPAVSPPREDAGS